MDLVCLVKHERPHVVNIHEAKTHFSRLVERMMGEEVVIGKAGRPVARLVPYVEDRGPRVPGGRPPPPPR